MFMEIKLKINGKDHVFQITPGEKLMDLLRREGYKSVKEGCREGNCGACVILLEGRPVNSCLVFAARCDGCRITTVEGLGAHEKLHPLQEAFLESGAVQCGYCTPGMLLSSKALLDEHPDPTVEEIKTGLDGNLCRCTGYVKIIKAVKKAAKNMKK